MSAPRKGNIQSDNEKELAVGKETWDRSNTRCSNSSARVSFRVAALTSCHNRIIEKGNADSPLCNIKSSLLLR